MKVLKRVGLSSWGGNICWQCCVRRLTRCVIAYSLAKLVHHPEPRASHICHRSWARLPGLLSLSWRTLWTRKSWQERRRQESARLRLLSKRMFKVEKQPVGSWSFQLSHQPRKRKKKNAEKEKRTQIVWTLPAWIRKGCCCVFCTRWHPMEENAESVNTIDMD